MEECPSFCRPGNRVPGPCREWVADDGGDDGGGGVVLPFPIGGGGYGGGGYGGG